MNDIIIYTKPERLLHKMGMLPVPEEADDAFGKNCRFYWRIEREIKDADKIERVYFATKGFIIGYFKVIDYDDYQFEWEASSWTLLDDPIETKSFQGFKYADKVPELAVKGGKRAMKLWKGCVHLEHLYCHKYNRRCDLASIRCNVMCYANKL